MKRRWIGLAPALALVLSCAPANRTQEVVFWQFFPAEAVNPLLRRYSKGRATID